MLTELEQRADTEARHAHRELVEELKAERDEALNQLDSARHSVDVLERRLTDKMTKLKKAGDTIDDLISTYVWVREDEYERGWAEMSNAIHEATFVQMELKETKQ